MDAYDIINIGAMINGITLLSHLYLVSILIY